MNLADLTTSEYEAALIEHNRRDQVHINHCTAMLGSLDLMLADFMAFPEDAESFILSDRFSATFDQEEKAYHRGLLTEAEWIAMQTQMELLTIARIALQRT